MKEFKKIIGNRVYLLLPKRKESRLDIPDEVKRELDEEYIKKLDRMKVYAIGDTVENVKENDEVFVDPHRLSSYVKLNLQDKTILIVSPFDIMHIW